MGNIGEANIGVGFDLSKISPEINEIVNLVSQAVEKMKNIFHFKADGIDGTKVEETFNGIGKQAQETDRHIKSMGESGNEAVKELLKFEVVKQAVEGLKEAFSRVKEYLLGFIEDFAAADLAVNKLRGGLERIGQKGWFDSLISQASELSKITPFDDDDITNMQSMLTTFDGISAEAIQRLTPAMLNLASAFAQGGDTGMNLTQVAILIGKSAGAELWSALKRIGIVMTEVQEKMLETTSGMDRINVFLEIMAQNGNITAEAFGKTLAGQLQIARNEIGNISESLGEVLAPAAEFVIAHVRNFSENLQKLPDAAKIAIVAIGAIFIAASGLVAVFTVLNIETAGVLMAIGALATGLAAFVTFIIAYIDEIKEWVYSHEDLKKIINDIMYSFGQLEAALGRLWDEISEVIGNTKTLREVLMYLIEAELRGLLITINLVLKAFDFLANVITIVVRGFGVFKDAVVNTLSIIVNVVQSGFNTVRNAIRSVLDLFDIPVPTTFTNSIAKVVDFAASKINSLRKSILGLFGLGEEANTAVVNVEAESGTVATTWKAGDYLPKTQPKSQEKEGKGESEKDPYKEETKNLRELLELQKRQIEHVQKLIELGEATPIQLLDILALHKKQLAEIQNTLEKQQNIEEVQNKILDIRIQENKILNLNKDAVNDTITLGKKIVEDDKKKFADKMERESKAYDELKNKRIQNETDAYQKSIDSINAKWDAEDKRIEETYKDTAVKEELLKQNRIARMQELRQAEMNDTSSFLNWTVQGFNSVQSAIQSGFSNMWTSVFGEANSLFEIFMQKVFEAFIALAATAVFKLILSVLAPEAAIVAYATPSPGFAVGGYTGDGRAGDVAGIVHKREFVVSEKGVNNETLPILEAMNRGENISRFLQDTVTVPSLSLPSVNISQKQSEGAGVKNISLGGISVSINSNSLESMNDQEWDRMVDSKLIPKISRGLKRLRKPVLDDKIK